VTSTPAHDPSAGPRSDRIFQGPRDLRSAQYRGFLTSRYGIERNALVGKYIFERRVYDSLDDVLDAAHAHDLLLCAVSQPAAGTPVLVFDPGTGTARLYASRSEAPLGTDRHVAGS
jgi:hypothetical protein